MTEPTKFDRKGCLTIIGMMVGLSVLITMCSMVQESGVSGAQKKRYDDCMTEKRKLGVGLVQADGVCAYWKTAKP
jgi:hypothetical protein